MRILIGNHIDPSIRERGDMRAWTQRLLWFARPGDLIILCCEPDTAFTGYALAHTGVPREELTVLATPAGVWGDRLLDPASLTTPAFVDRVRAALGPAGAEGAVSEVFALWPSAAVARLADALGVADRFPGAAFFVQGGGEIGNSKANFRALAAAAGVPVLPGRVCRSRAEAVEATGALLEHSPCGAVVVKQAHNGACCRQPVARTRAEHGRRPRRGPAPAPSGPGPGRHRRVLGSAVAVGERRGPVACRRRGVRARRRCGVLRALRRRRGHPAHRDGPPVLRRAAPEPPGRAAERSHRAGTGGVAGRRRPAGRGVPGVRLPRTPQRGRPGPARRIRGVHRGQRPGLRQPAHLPADRPRHRRRHRRPGPAGVRVPRPAHLGGARLRNVPGRARRARPGLRPGHPYRGDRVDARHPPRAGRAGAVRVLRRLRPRRGPRRGVRPARRAVRERTGRRPTTPATSAPAPCPSPPDREPHP